MVTDLASWISTRELLPEIGTPVEIKFHPDGNPTTGARLDDALWRVFVVMWESQARFFGVPSHWRPLDQRREAA